MLTLHTVGNKIEKPMASCGYALYAGFVPGMRIRLKIHRNRLGIHWIRVQLLRRKKNPDSTKNGVRNFWLHSAQIQEKQQQIIFPFLFPFMNIVSSWFFFWFTKIWGQKSVLIIQLFAIKYYWYQQEYEIIRVNQ